MGPDMAGVATPLQGMMNDEPSTWPEGPPSAAALSDAIMVGSMLLQGRTFLIGFCLGTSVLLGLLILGLLRHFQRKQQLLFWKLSEISEQLEKQTDRAQREAPMSPPDLSSLDSPLQCIDAKLLQLDKEAREIRHFLTTLDAEQSFDKLGS